MLCYFFFHCIFKSFCFLFKFILLWYLSCHLFPSNSLLSFPVHLAFSLSSAPVSLPHQSPFPFCTFVNSCQDPVDLNTQPSMHPPPTINLSSSHLFPARAHPCVHPHTHIQTEGFLGSRGTITVYVYKIIYLAHIDSPSHVSFLLKSIKWACREENQRFFILLLERKEYINSAFQLHLLVGVGPGRSC